MRIRLAAGLFAAVLLFGGCASQKYPTIITTSTATTTTVPFDFDWDFNFEDDVIDDGQTATTTAGGAGSGNSTTVSKSKTSTTTATTTITTTAGLDEAMTGKIAEVVRYTGRYADVNALTANQITAVIPFYMEDMQAYLVVSNGVAQIELTADQVNTVADTVFGRNVDATAVDTVTQSYRIYWDAAKERLVYRVSPSQENTVRFVSRSSRAVGSGYEVAVWQYTVCVTQPDGVEGTDWANENGQYWQINERYTASVNRDGQIEAVK